MSVFCALISPVCGKFYPLEDIFMVVNLGYLIQLMGLFDIWLIWGPPTVVYLEMCCCEAGLPTFYCLLDLIPIKIF